MLHLINPKSTLIFIFLKPGAVKENFFLCVGLQQRLEKGPWIAEQCVVRRPVVFQFFWRAVDANQFQGFREEGRIAEIHLVVQFSTNN